MKIFKLILLIVMIYNVYIFTIISLVAEQADIEKDAWFFWWTNFTVLDIMVLLIWVIHWATSPLIHKHKVNRDHFYADEEYPRDTEIRITPD